MVAELKLIVGSFNPADRKPAHLIGMDSGVFPQRSRIKQQLCIAAADFIGHFTRFGEITVAESGYKPYRLGHNTLPHAGESRIFATVTEIGYIAAVEHRIDLLARKKFERWPKPIGALGR